MFMSDLFKAIALLGLAVGCFQLPGVVGTKVPCSDECVQPEDEWCSGATPDYPSHWEAWNTLPPTTEE